MGLDTSHNCWHGPYSSFNRFREKLAGLIDIPDLKAHWDSGQDFPHDIHPLLNHSDCDGELSVTEAQQVANGLTAILEKKDDNPEDKWFWERVVLFRDGCLDAVLKNEVIDFH
jgi:hypothetical protein